MPKIAHPSKPLADVNVIQQADGSHEIVVCFMPDPELMIGEGHSHAFLALDASLSLKKMYGYGGPFGGDPNHMQAVARKLASMLCDMTHSGHVTGLYWAVSPDGSATETIGAFDQQTWMNTSITGPKKEKWGKGTRMLPVLNWIRDDLAKQADWIMGVILTDGQIDDEQACLDICMNMGRDMANGAMSQLKLILIGLGEKVNKEQLERFDDMFEGTDLADAVDIWSCRPINSIENEDDIMNVLYGELMNEDTVVAPNGRVESGSGQLLGSWDQGLPGRFRFILPRGETRFVVRTPIQDVTQDCSQVIHG